MSLYKRPVLSPAFDSPGPHNAVDILPSPLGDWEDVNQKHYLLQTPSPKEVLTWALLPDGTVVAKLSAMGAAVCVMVNEIATGNALDTTGRTSCQHLTVKRKAD